MTDKVNGGVQAGEFLTGNMDFFTIVSVVPMAQTNVTTPVADLYTQQGYTTWQDVTVIDGSGTPVTYSTEVSYTDALVKQSNLNTLLQIFAQNVNPVAISVSVETISDPSGETYTGFLNGTAFGSGYNSSRGVTTVKLATEKTGYWNVSTAAESNALGYQFLTALNNIPCTATSTAAVSGNKFVTGSGDAATRNTLAIRSLVL